MTDFDAELTRIRGEDEADGRELARLTGVIDQASAAIRELGARQRERLRRLKEIQKQIREDRE